jgi:uncharacterized Zn-finger protein
MATIPPPEVTYVESRRTRCDGDERNGDGHPRVWLEIDAGGWVDCLYCDRRFVLAGGPADQR